MIKLVTGKSRFESCTEFYIADRNEFQGQEAKAFFMAIAPQLY